MANIVAKSDLIKHLGEVLRIKTKPDLDAALDRAARCPAASQFVLEVHPRC